MSGGQDPALGPRRWKTIGELLDHDDATGRWCAVHEFNRVAGARRRFCAVEEIPAGVRVPCAWCRERPAQFLVDGVPIDLGCGDPPPGFPDVTPPPPWLREPAGEQEETGKPEPEDACAAQEEPSAQDGPAPDGAAAAALPDEPAPGSGTPEDRDAQGTGQDSPAGAAGPGPAGETLAAVIDLSGLWLPGADAPVPAGVPQDAGQAWELADLYRVRQLWIHPSAAGAAGLPGGHSGNPQSPDDHPWARAGGYLCDPPGLAAWMHVSPDGGGRRRAVVLPAYESRAPWEDAPDGRVLADAIAAFAAAMPPACNYYYSPNLTGAAVIRHHVRGELPDSVMPPPGASRLVTHVASWSRTLLDEEDGSVFLHRYDERGAQLAVFGTKLGVGTPVHVASPQWGPRSKYTAGYWLISVPDGWTPDPLLPDLLRPWQRAGEKRVWVPTPFIELLANDLSVPVTVHEAWLWPESSAWLETAGHSLRDARAALIEASDGCGTCAPCIALDTVKACYTSLIGYFARRTAEGEDKDEDGPRLRLTPAGEDGLVTAGDPLWLPYANDAFVSKALCNGYRRLRRTGERDYRYPVAIFNDAAYFTSNETDGARGIPPSMTLGNRFGQYKHEATVPLAAVSAELGENRFHQAVERYLRGHR